MTRESEGPRDWQDLRRIARRGAKARKQTRLRRFAAMLYSGETDPARLAPALENATLDMPDGIHTIPVPQGWSIEQSWEAIANGDELPDGPASWANVEISDGEMERVIRDD